MEFSEHGLINHQIKITIIRLNSSEPMYHVVYSDLTWIFRLGWNMTYPLVLMAKV